MVHIPHFASTGAVRWWRHTVKFKHTATSHRQTDSTVLLSVCLSVPIQKSAVTLHIHKLLNQIFVLVSFLF